MLVQLFFFNLVGKLSNGKTNLTPPNDYVDELAQVKYTKLAINIHDALLRIFEHWGPAAVLPVCLKCLKFRFECIDRESLVCLLAEVWQNLL